MKEEWVAACAEVGAAIGTVGTLIAALWFAGAEGRRRRKEERRHQAEQISAWLHIENIAAATIDGETDCIVLNGSSQLIYNPIITIVSATGAFRKTGVGMKPDDSLPPFQTRMGGAFPPGQQSVRIKYPGDVLQARYSVELAFRDLRGRFWIRDADGMLKEVKEDPLVLYGSGPPGPGPGTVEMH
jgi:hypothetical protein